MTIQSDKSIVMLRAILFITGFLFSRSVGKNVESLVVNTRQGSVRGYKSLDGDFYVFYGIPYATAPTGTKRFQAPLPPPVWQDTFEASDQNVICPQFISPGSIYNDNRQQRENCLVVNLYVPKTEEKYLPVLVYVHGGGYNVGYGEIRTSKHLAMSKRAIIVNFNYRLGAHGFLCLGTKDAPGNAGLKDQVALLKWIKDNISEFGGNPNDVTIAGFSAGASSVDLLMLSKMANDLFNKVIPESGANTAMFSIQENPVECAKTYAKQLNFTNVDDVYALEMFYKTSSYDLITSIDMFIENNNCTFTFVPCVERDTGVERFLDDNPINILKSGNYQKRPILYGIVKMEGMIRLGTFDLWKEMMKMKCSEFLPSNLQFQNEDEKEIVAAKVKVFYFGTKPVSGDTIMGYINYYTDTMFAYPTLLSLRLQIEAGNKEIYLYEYVYADESSPIIPYIGLHGTDHCSQSWAVQDGCNLTHADESIASDGYKNMKRMVREMWLNFVTTGEPVPKGSSLPTWPPAGPDASPYMVLDEVLTVKETPMLEKRMRFWDQIYNRYYRPRLLPSIPQILFQRKRLNTEGNINKIFKS